MTTDDPLWARLIMLAAAVGFFISVSGLIFADPTWFNPAETNPPAWHEVFRLLAGPITAGLVCLITLPADWGPEVVGRAGHLPGALVINLRLSDTDLIMAVLPKLVQEESHAGRELVINETHGALSTNLRLLEQQTRELRSVAPALHDLAVSANSRLRETLTLARLGSESSDSVQNLDAPVLTPGPGGRGPGRGGGDGGPARTGRPGPGPAGAQRPGRQCAQRRRRPRTRHDRRGRTAVAISVRDDAPPMAPGVWKTPGTSSARPKRS